MISGTFSKAPESLAPVMTAAALYMDESVLKNFLEGGRPQKWQPTKSGAPSHLYGNGALLGSKRHVSDDFSAALMIGGGIPYAWIHQEGGIIHHPGSKEFQVFSVLGETVFTHGTKPHEILIPARPYMMFQDEDIQYLEELIGRYIVDFMNVNKEVINV